MKRDIKKRNPLKKKKTEATGVHGEGGRLREQCFHNQCVQKELFVDPTPRPPGKREAEGVGSGLHGGVSGGGAFRGAVEERRRHRGLS